MTNVSELENSILHQLLVTKFTSLNSTELFLLKFYWIAPTSKTLEFSQLTIALNNLI